MTHLYLMSDTQQNAYDIVTLLGGGPVDAEDLKRLIRLAPDLVAADGGANYAHAHKIPVKHIVGDFDSLTNEQYWRNSGVNLTQVDEQNSTDFEKCLYTIEAEIYLCIGFLGRMLDHSLACLRTLAAYPDRKVILVGEEEVVFLSPLNFRIDLPAGTRVSLFPMGDVRGEFSDGLKWSIEGLEFSPAGQIGTSNEAAGGELQLKFSDAKMLILLPKAFLEPVIEALGD